MKRLLIVTTFIFTGFISKAQTKAETLQWICEKMSSARLAYSLDSFDNQGDEYYMNTTANGMYLFSPSNHDIEIFQKVNYRKVKDNGANWSRSLRANLDNLTNAKICPECKQGDNIPIQLVFKANTVACNFWSAGATTAQKSQISAIPLYLNWDAESDLQNRMMKALLHLIELQSQKQTF